MAVATLMAPFKEQSAVSLSLFQPVRSASEAINLTTEPAQFACLSPAAKAVRRKINRSNQTGLASSHARVKQPTRVRSELLTKAEALSYVTTLVRENIEDARNAELPATTRKYAVTNAAVMLDKWTIVSGRAESSTTRDHEDHRAGVLALVQKLVALR